MKGAGSPLTDVLNPHQVKSGVWRVESGAEGTRLPPMQGEGDRRAVEGFCLREWRPESGVEGTRLPPLQGEGDRRAVEGF